MSCRPNQPESPRGQKGRTWLRIRPCEGAIKRRIMDMGITKGTDIYVRKVAPLGDPIEVTVRGFELSLRKNEAQNVLVS